MPARTDPDHVYLPALPVRDPRQERTCARIGRDYAGKVAIIAVISSNDAGYVADDSPEKLKEMADEELGFNFPLCLRSETQDVAISFLGGVHTRYYFLFDKDRQLAYRGQIDGSRPGQPGAAVDGHAICVRLWSALLNRHSADSRSASRHRVQHQMETRKTAGVLSQRTCEKVS